MLELDTPHEFVLLYRNPALVGSAGGRARVDGACEILAVLERVAR